MLSASAFQQPVARANGELYFSHTSGIRLKNLTPVIVLTNQQERLKAENAVQREFNSNSILLEWAMGLVLSIQVKETAGGLLIESSLNNTSGAPVALERIYLLQNADITTPNPLTRALVNGVDMNSYSGIVELTSDVGFNSVVGLTSAKSESALVLGFLDVREAYYDFHVGATAGAAKTICAYTKRDGIELLPGSTLELSPLSVQFGEGLSPLLEAYAQDSGRLMEARKVPLQTGWCSWYTFYGTDTVQDIQQNLQALKSSSLAGHLKTIQLDDGWNYTCRNAPRNWGDWHAGYKFPNGMKAIADEINGCGLKPGLWLAPFSVDPGSEFFKEPSRFAGSIRRSP